MAVQDNQPNILGVVSLVLGVASIALVFGIALCSLVGETQGWLLLAGTGLYVCGASSAFLGFLAAILGWPGFSGLAVRGWRQSWAC